MNELTTQIANMDSREIAELTGKRHDHVIRDIKLQLESQEIALPKFGGTYIDTQGKQRPCFKLDKEQVMVLVTGYSIPLRVKVIKRLNELEAKQPKLPTTYKEALQELLIKVEQNEVLQLENTAQKQIIGELQPIVDYTNEILKATGAITITQIAKDYGLTGAKLNKILHEENVQYKQSGQWMLYSRYHGMKYTESTTTQFMHKNGSLGCRVSTKWTQKGRLFIHDILKKREIIAVIEQEEK